MLVAELEAELDVLRAELVLLAGRRRQPAQARQLRLTSPGPPGTRAQSIDVIPEDNRFESDPAEALPEDPGFPAAGRPAPSTATTRPRWSD